MKRKTMRTLLCVAVVALMMTAMSVTAFAASGDVAGAVENTWNAAKSQVQTVVNNVVFPVIDIHIGLNGIYLLHFSFQPCPLII